MNRMQTVRVSSVEREGERMSTLRFPFERQVEPGQFFMVWIPGVDEIPMSASYVYGEKGITVRDVGTATNALCSVKPGARVGVRGPYGNGYDIVPGRSLLIAGGTGAASLLPVADFIADRKQVDVLIGARKKSELIFVERARKLSWEVHVSTDDGSEGLHGTVVDLAKRHVQKRAYDMVYACGPEKMLAGVVDFCKQQGLPGQFSLERYMKCGSGLCGSCVIGGKRVCADGPVFTLDEIVRMQEFGGWKRDQCGLRIKL